VTGGAHVASLSTRRWDKAVCAAIRFRASVCLDKCMALSCWTNKRASYRPALIWCDVRTENSLAMEKAYAVYRRVYPAMKSIPR